MSRNSDPVGKADPLEAKSQLGGFFNLTSTAKAKIQKKRKRKGLGDKYPKKVATMTQLYVGLTSSLITKLFLAPLERTKIVLQISHLANYTTFTKPKGSFAVLGSKISLI